MNYIMETCLCPQKGEKSPRCEYVIWFMSHQTLKTLTQTQTLAVQCCALQCWSPCRMSPAGPRLAGLLRLTQICILILYTHTHVCALRIRGHKDTQAHKYEGTNRSGLNRNEHTHSSQPLTHRGQVTHTHTHPTVNRYKCKQNSV